MNSFKWLYMPGVALLMAGAIIATEPDITEYSPPKDIDFSYDSSWSGRAFTPGESSVVAQAICSIATAPPESITYTTAAGSTITVSCSTLAAKLQGQLEKGTMEAETLNDGADGGEYGGEINVHEDVLKAAIDSNNTDYLEELLVHEAMHKGQTSTNTNEREVEAHAAELAYKDSIGLDTSDAEYRFAKSEHDRYLLNYLLPYLIRQMAERSWLGRYIAYILPQELPASHLLVTYYLGGQEEYHYDLDLGGAWLWFQPTDQMAFSDYFPGSGHHLLLMAGRIDMGGMLAAARISEGQVVEPYPYWNQNYPFALYSMARWSPTSMYYLVDTLDNNIYTQQDMDADQLPDGPVGVFAFGADFPELEGMLSVEPTEHVMHGFGLIVNHEDAHYTHLIEPYETRFFLMDTDGDELADVLMDVYRYEFVIIKPQIVDPPWGNDWSVNVFGTWTHNIQVWSTDETGDILLEELGAVPLDFAVHATCPLFLRPLLEGEYILAVDGDNGMRLTKPTQVITPPVEELTINFDSNDGMLKVYWKPVEGAQLYEIYTSPDGMEFFFTGLVTPDTEFWLPLPTEEIQFYQVRAIRGIPGSR